MEWEPLGILEAPCSSTGGLAELLTVASRVGLELLQCLPTFFWLTKDPSHVCAFL